MGTGMGDTRGPALGRRALLTGAAGGAVTLAAPPLPAAAPRLTVFRIAREGDAIGTHTIRFPPPDVDGTRRVLTEIDITVKVLGFTAYEYRQRAEEVWRGGLLRALRTRTTRSRDPDRAVEAERRDGTLHVERRKDGAVRNRYTVQGEVLTTSLWHPATLVQTRLLGLEDGKLRDIEARYLGTETITVPGGTARAEHHELRGDFARELWYDSNGRILRAAFNAERDGSRIVLTPHRLAG